jgi:hypothetical protein
MKIITRSVQKVVFEATADELNKRGFDSLWDEIREGYPEQEFDLHTVEESKNIYFELKPVVAEE